jgi:antitoxin VapB
MSLNVKNEETYKLAQALSKETGETMTDAVTVALKERLERLHRKNKKKNMARDLLEIDARFSKLVKAKPFDRGEFLYDENGLPKRSSMLPRYGRFFCWSRKRTCLLPRFKRLKVAACRQQLSRKFPS